MELFFELLQMYWKETVSAIILALIGIYRKWIGKVITNVIFWFRSMCPGKSIIKRLDEISNELKSNHGSSLRDAVNRIDNKVTNIHYRMNAFQSSYDIMSDTLNISRFTADINGKLTFVNIPLKLLIGVVDKDALLKDSWLDFVHMDDRVRLESDIRRNVNNKTSGHHTFRIINPQTKEVIKVTSHSKPIMDVTIPDKVVGWTGILVKHHEQESTDY